MRRILEYIAEKESVSKVEGVGWVGLFVADKVLAYGSLQWRALW